MLRPGRCVFCVKKNRAIKWKEHKKCWSNQTKNKDRIKFVETAAVFYPSVWKEMISSVAMKLLKKLRKKLLLPPHTRMKGQKYKVLSKKIFEAGKSNKMKLKPFQKNCEVKASLRMEPSRRRKESKSSTKWRINCHTVSLSCQGPKSFKSALVRPVHDCWQQKKLNSSFYDLLICIRQLPPVSAAYHSSFFGKLCSYSRLPPYLACCGRQRREGDFVVFFTIFITTTSLVILTLYTGHSIFCSSFMLFITGVLSFLSPSWTWSLLSLAKQDMFIILLYDCSLSSLTSLFACCKRWWW